MKMAYRDNPLLRNIIRFCFEWQDRILKNYLIFLKSLDLYFTETHPKEWKFIYKKGPFLISQNLQIYYFTKYLPKLYGLFFFNTLTLQLNIQHKE